MQSCFHKSFQFSCTFICILTSTFQIFLNHCASRFANKLYIGPSIYDVARSHQTISLNCVSLVSNGHTNYLETRDWFLFNWSANLLTQFTNDIFLLLRFEKFSITFWVCILYHLPKLTYESSIIPTFRKAIQLHIRNRSVLVHGYRVYWKVCFWKGFDKLMSLEFYYMPHYPLKRPTQWNDSWMALLLLQDWKLSYEIIPPELHFLGASRHEYTIITVRWIKHSKDLNRKDFFDYAAWM